MLKNIPILFFQLAAILTLFTNCKKSDENINPEEVRLLAIETDQGNGDVHHTNIHYDATGRIERVSTRVNGAASQTSFTVSYSGNEIILALRPINEPSSTIIDSIYLFLNSSNKLEKRFHKSSQEFRAPSNPQRTYVYDTTIFEYDGAGILKKETLKHFDTTWFNPGTATTAATRSTDITEYSVSGGNIISARSVSQLMTISYFPGRVINTINSKETNTQFGYSRAFSNKTDFANVAILNELLLHYLPLNPNQSNLPDRLDETITQKDGSGNIVAVSRTIQNQQFTYTSYGFIASRFDEANSNLKTRYIYNK